MVTELKALVCKTIDDRNSDLNKISQEIWNNPELSFNEHFAHELLTTFLEKEGFEVNKKTPLETSFIARYGCGSGLKIGVICEYDALPGIGHACGHNLIAEAGIAAALGIKAVLMNRPDLKVQLVVFGTPAEEDGGGKVKMVEKGVFDEADICMMSHPTPIEAPSPVMLSISHLSIVFKGCTVDFTEDGPSYSAVKTNKVLIDFYVNNAKSLGVDFPEPDSSKTGSTDMGNVSQIKPSIHPLYRINTAGANHTHEFTKATGSAESQLPTLNSGKSMAMTAIDVICTPNIMKEILNDFKSVADPKELIPLATIK